MDKNQKELIIKFNYKEKYCEEDTLNYKFSYLQQLSDNSIVPRNLKYCNQWDEKNKCFIENSMVFNDNFIYSINELSQQLGCISCCKDCSNKNYIQSLISLKSKSISNISQEMRILNENENENEEEIDIEKNNKKEIKSEINDYYKIITFRNKMNITDIPILYNIKSQNLNFCSQQKKISSCSIQYTCYPVQSRGFTSNEIDNEAPNFANIIFILLFIVVVISVIALIWIVIYVIRTYRRHKRMNQVIDENGEEICEEEYNSEDDKEYLSDNYDYCYKPSEIANKNNSTIIKLKYDS
ncbi:hypothetical protein BCR32DRAFT_279514 [Anaeromyces robustus]|uniref:Uncharacterized protein n=1 Tax=Anaeromyces robustus TaxID=1754192 RepID=A0A1Y1X8K8_9FUNG|nr:hypothetical protein BCR32DRAFT_279514 [Anaeromyces robustus]|eukprot:ORX81756.1 hypothetical protein BCR32DRAFT_279514 [Anaeromyces robustus]